MKRKISFLTLPIVLYLALISSNPLNGQTVTYPTASGIGWRMGSIYNITWSGFSPGFEINIELYKGSSLSSTIISGTTNDGSYSWIVPTSLAIASDYRIRISQYFLSQLLAQDFSDNYFTIANPEVTYPSASGIFWRTGSSHTITWSGFTGSYVRIDLYKGASLNTVITTSTANDGSYSYTVPSSFTFGNDYSIRIASTSLPAIFDVSSAYFTISNPQVTYPTASGVCWRPGNSYIITWTGFASPNVKIELYKSGSLDRSIVSSTTNDGSYTYTVPASLPIAIDYYVRITSTTVPAEYDYSNSYFAVGNPQVTYPSASGIIWRPGSSYTIAWSGYPGSYVKIDLYYGSSLYNVIISSTDNDGSYSYTVPSTLPVSSSYNIRITSTANSGCYDASNYYFTVANPLVTYPSVSGITWNVGSTYNITWSGFPGTVVRIDLYKGTTLFDVISASTSNDGTHPWTVPTEPAGSDYYVRITSTSNASIYDNSNYYFTIAAFLNVTPTSISLTSGSGANGTFNITSNTSWSITDDAAWLSVSPVSGTNNATVTVTAVSANSGSSPRTATVTIAGSGVTPNKTVTVTQAASVPTNTLGNTTVYGSSSTTANRRAIIVTCAESGTIQSISIYHNGGTGRVLLGVYADVSGSPGGRLGVTPATAISASAGWQTVSLSSPVTITAGQKVWLSWVFENNPGIRYITGTPARAESTATWPGGMPNPFGSATFANYKYSVYCTYIPGAGPVTKTLGNTTVYGSTSTTANRRAQTVTFTEAGTIQSLSMYHNGGTGRVIFGVYADASGAPGARLGVTAETIINASAGWQNVSLITPVGVAPDQKVWLAWVFENNPGIRYITGTPARAESPNVWAGRMPDPFGTSSFANYKYSLYCTYTTGTAPLPKTLGNTEVYSSSSTTANRRAITVTFPEPGTVQSISIYHNGGTGNVLLGIYTDASGAPGTRLGVTASTVINPTAGWQTIPLISGYSAASGQKVWLAWVFQTNPGIRYITGTPARAESPGLWAGGMPDPFGTASFANYRYSIYCTYITGGGDEIKDPDETKSVNMPTDINSILMDRENVLIYPNPTEGEITITWKNRYSHRLDITIYNIVGQAVKEIQTDPDINEIRMDLGKTSRGVYLFEMKDKTNDVILNRSRIIRK